jgi:hypothetical protein
MVFSGKEMIRQQVDHVQVLKVPVTKRGGRAIQTIEEI